MNNQTFRSLKASRKAKLAQVLASKGLSPLEVTQVVGHTTNFDDQKGHLVDNQMAVKVHPTIEGFADAVTLRRIGTTHSWAGNTVLLESGEWVIGGGTFGLHSDLRHSENGDLSAPYVIDELPEFELGLTQVALVRTIDEDSREGSRYYEEDYALQIYLGSPVGDEGES